MRHHHLFARHIFDNLRLPRRACGRYKSSCIVGTSSWSLLTCKRSITLQYEMSQSKLLVEVALWNTGCDQGAWL